VYLRLIPLYLSTFMVGVLSNVITGLIHVVSGDLQVSIAAAGQLTAVFALVYALAAPVMGALTSPVSRRAALLVALGITIVGCAATALAPNYLVAMIARAFSAVGAAAVNPIATATAAESVEPARRGKAIGFVVAGLATSQALGLPFGTLVGGIGWRPAFWILAALALVAAIGVAATVRLPAPGRDSLAERLSPLKDPWVLVLLLASFLTFTGMHSFYAYVAVAATPPTGGSPVLLSLVFITGGAAAIVGSTLMGAAVDRFRAVVVMIAGLAVLVGALLISPLAMSGLWSAFAWFAVWGLVSFSGVVPQQQRVYEYSPERSPMLLGLNSGAVYAGIAGGAALGGLLQQWIPIGLLGLPGAALVAVALLLTLSQRRAAPGVVAR